MPRKKILHIIHSLGNGGCENMLLRTLPVLTDGFEHHIIALREPGELAPQFVQQGIPVTTVHWRGFLHIPGYQRLLACVRQYSPDVTLTYLLHADIIGRLFLQNKVSPPLIPFLRTTYNHPKYLIAQLFEKLTKHLVPHYLANSQAVKDFYVSKIGVSAEKITVIPNGIDTNFFDSIKPDPELRKSLRIDPDDFIIICVANLHVNKGHRYLLEAFESLFCHSRAGGNPVKLLIVGEGIERSNLEQQIANYQSKGSISFLGRRTDIPELLKISNCFVLPTLFEGMSNAIMEAMASGLPVITTDIPENKILIENHINGTLIPVENSLALSQAIRKFLRNPKKTKILSEKAKEKIQDSFSLKKSLNSFRNFLNSL